MSAAATTMAGPLSNLASPHFALLYIDERGRLRFEASPSIANDCHSILSPEVTNSFLKAVAGSGDGPVNAGFEAKHDLRNRSPRSSHSPTTSNFSPGSSISSNSDNPRKRKRASHEYVLPMSIMRYPKSMRPIRNRDLLQRYYEKAFDTLQQTNCRILAKAYIKLVEPRKQVNYPYNGRKTVAGVPQRFDPEETRPHWWPSGVIHREPDHLGKPERIRLLVYILSQLRESHNITVERLKEADQSIRRQISPARLQVLDEIYRVRAAEERYLDGHSDGQEAIYISRVNLPEMAECQTSAYSPVGSSFESDGAYRDDVPDLESHTSVFPSSVSSCSSRAREAATYPHTPASIPPSILPTASTWDASQSALPSPVSLPSINPNPSVKQFGTESAAAPYTFNFPTSTFAQYEPTPALTMQPYPMNAYTTLPFHTGPHHASGQQGHSQSHNSIPAVRVQDMSSSPHPYYFDY